ncbi:MAG: hypothetical protein JSV82_08790 [Planctomycetota bacterium]|nr:MAG: hypothetical protein JSV82_08790 [Planctomycetota bacterium]
MEAEVVKRTSRIAIAFIISSIIMSIFAFIAFLHPFQQILVSGIFLLFGFILFCFFIPVFTIVFFHNRKLTKKATTMIGVLMLAIYLLSIIWIFAHVLFPHLPLRKLSLLFITITILLALVTGITSFQGKTIKAYFSLIVFVILLSVPLILIAPMALSFTLPYIYTPPTLTSENLIVYNEYVKFVTKYDEYRQIKPEKNEDMSNWGYYGLTHILHGGDERKYFSKKQIIEMRILSEQLYNIKCNRTRRSNDMLLFYKNANYILPVRPGVVYSLSGDNPNESYSEVLDAAKPFVKISGDWYMSRHLMLGGPRIAAPVSIPESLIDHSLRIDGIDPEDLMKFD